MTVRTGLAAAAVGLVLAGCGGSGGPRQHAVLRVTPRSALIDAPASVAFDGLRAG